MGGGGLERTQQLTGLEAAPRPTSADITPNFSPLSREHQAPRASSLCCHERHSQTASLCCHGCRARTASLCCRECRAQTASLYCREHRAQTASLCCHECRVPIASLYCRECRAPIASLYCHGRRSPTASLCYPEHPARPVASQYFHEPAPHVSNPCWRALVRRPNTKVQYVQLRRQVGWGQTGRAEAAINKRGSTARYLRLKSMVWIVCGENVGGLSSYGVCHSSRLLL